MLIQTWIINFAVDNNILMESYSVFVTIVLLSGKHLLMFHFEMFTNKRLGLK